MSLTTPKSLQAEHGQLRGALRRATGAGGSTAKAATRLAEGLRDHFEREDRCVLPLLSLLPALAAGGDLPFSQDARALAEAMTEVMPRMHDEHETAARLLNDLRRAAGEELKPEFVAFADSFEHHMKLEEELFYPAAVVVAMLVRRRSPQGR